MLPTDGWREDPDEKRTSAYQFGSIISRAKFHSQQYLPLESRA